MDLSVHIYYSKVSIAQELVANHIPLYDYGELCKSEAMDNEFLIDKCLIDFKVKQESEAYLSFSCTLCR